MIADMITYIIAIPRLLTKHATMYYQDMSASITMRELVRMDVIKELTMTARVFLGEEAQQLGLVTR